LSEFDSEQALGTQGPDFFVFLSYSPDGFLKIILHQIWMDMWCIWWS